MSLRAIVLALALCAPPALAGSVSLSTDDGVKLAGQSWGSGSKGVLLVHEDGRDHSTWGTFAERLSGAGFRVLAVDLRGHGGSTTPAPLAEADYQAMVADVDAGVAWLKANGASDVMVVGAALGANVALNAATDNPDIHNVVMLSPALNANGVKVSGAIGSYGDRPLLLVAAETDAMSVKTAGFLQGKAAGSTRFEQYPGSETGSRMLNAVPDLENLIVGWLNGSFEQPEPGEGLQSEVKTGEVEDVEVRGTRLEDRER